MRHQLFLSSLILSLLLLPTTGAANVGKIILTSGKVFATQADGKRKLRRGSRVFQGDSIITEKNSRAQIRFMDGALVSLKESSIFKVIEYEFKSNHGSSSLRLIKGGFRTVTGLITKKTDREYKISIGDVQVDVSGTYWGGSITSNQQVLLGVWSGRIFGETGAGKLFNLGENQSNNFALINPQGDVIPLQEQPDALDGPGLNREQKKPAATQARQRKLPSETTTQAETDETNEQEVLPAFAERQVIPNFITTTEHRQVLITPFINTINDFAGVTLVDGIDANFAIIAATRLAKGYSNAFGVTARDTRVVNPELDKQEVGGAAYNHIPSNSGAISNNIKPENISGMISAPFDAEHFQAYSTPPDIWGNADVGLIYGKWSSPVPLLPIGAPAKLLQEDLNIALARPIINAGSFSGVTFNDVNFSQAGSGVTLNNFSMQVSYNAALSNALTLSAIDFQISTASDTFDEGGLFAGSHNFEGPAFRLDFSGTSTGGSPGPFTGVLTGILTGNSSSGGSNAGVLAGIDIHKTDTNDNIEVIFGVTP